MNNYVFAILFTLSFFFRGKTEELKSTQEMVINICQQFRSEGFTLETKEDYNTLKVYIETICGDCRICIDCKGCNKVVNGLIWKSILLHPKLFVDMVDSLNKEEFHEILKQLSKTTEDVPEIKKAIKNLEVLKFNSNLKMWMTRSMKATLKRKLETY